MFGFSFIQSLKNNNSAIRMRDIVENIILAHSGMQQQPYGIGIGAWGHGNGDFIFIAKTEHLMKYLRSFILYFILFTFSSTSII